MGNGGTGVLCLWAMGHRGYGSHGQWGTGAMRPTGGMGYRVQGYGAHGQ